MEPMDDAVRVLAQRLRSLRTRCWPHVKVTQPMLGEALGGQDGPLSVALISSWESKAHPKVPPISRLEAYATLFCTARSVQGGTLRLLDPGALTPGELAERERLLAELLGLRAAALGQAAPMADAGVAGNPWQFHDDLTITIVCSQLPREMLERLPYSDPDDPDYIELYNYADLDALVELYGHIRALNPKSTVMRRTTATPPDYAGHIVILGGVDWNNRTREVLENPSLPIRQVANWDEPDGVYFEVERPGTPQRHHPVLKDENGHKVLTQDVALFYRGPNPLIQGGTITMCNGMYGRGTYGAVRALTDPQLADRNAQHLAGRFAGQTAFSLLTRVVVVAGTVVTPDWTIGDNVLHEWPAPGEKPQ